MHLVSIYLFTILLAPLAAVVFKPLAGGGYTFIDLFRDPTMVRLSNAEPSPLHTARQAFPVRQVEL